MVIKNAISKYQTKSDISLRVSKKYWVFAILGGICIFILSILIPINLLLAFIAYTSVKLYNYHFAQMLGAENISFMKMFEMLFGNNIEFMRIVFVTMALAFLSVCISAYVLGKIDNASIVSREGHKIVKEGE